VQWRWRWSHVWLRLPWRRCLVRLLRGLRRWLVQRRWRWSHVRLRLLQLLRYRNRLLLRLLQLRHQRQWLV
jgi:hypothetical protein